ncbi:cobalamin-dependent protein [Candidatus Pacearchaeota archaeon]|nr:cobalamin-dependent protein [Candidatus Pacearchaeota archaeon]
MKSVSIISKNEFKVLILMPRFQLTTKITYNYMIPLGLLYISSTIKREGYVVNSVNLNHMDGTISEIMKKELDKEKYDVVCTSLIGGPSYPIVEKIVESTKEHITKPKIIIGGALITSEPELMFSSLGIDFGVLGEGEITIVELLEAIRKGVKEPKKIKGIIYKDNNEKIIKTEKREPIKDLTSISYPDFEGFEFSEYLKHLSSNQQTYNQSYDYPLPYPLLASRSCPFQCTFCYHSIGYAYRERPISDVINEIKKAIKDYKMNIIAIYDDMFSYKKERLYEFCNEIIKINKEIPWKLKWSCQLSVANLDRDLLKKMKESGCELISYGFESYSQKVLDSMRKPITPEKIDFAIKATLAEKIGILGNFIFGDVAETKETAKQTLDYWKKNCRGQVALGFIQPFPGSAIYHHCLKKGIIKDKLKFIKEIIYGKKVFNMTDEMTNEEISDLFKEVRRLRNKYMRHSVPMSVEKEREERYKIKLKCPYCCELLVYKNFYLQKRLLYRSHITCRKCHMRFYVLSPLIGLSGMFPLLSLFAEMVIRKIRSDIKVTQI